MPINRPSRLEDYMLLVTEERRARPEPQVQDKQMKPRTNFLEELRIDAEDTLFEVFKGMQNICNYQHYSIEQVHQGGRHYQRDDVRFQRIFNVYFKGNLIIRTQLNPHSKITVFKVADRKTRTRFAQRIILEAAREFFPQAKVKENS